MQKFFFFEVVGHDTQFSVGTYLQILSPVFFLFEAEFVIAVSGAELNIYNNSYQKPPLCFAA